MASPFSSSGVHGGNKGPTPMNPQQPVLSVAPLNSMPYIGPHAPVGDHASSQAAGYTKDSEKMGPSAVFLPSHTTRNEWDNIMATAKCGIGLTGSAAMGKFGPVVGLVDIGECEDSYLFRVSLPGVARDEKDFSCDIEPDGKILIRGVTTTGEKTVCKKSLVFRMQTQNLCPPGRFSVAFHLPGPVDHQQFQCSFGTDGILEGLVKKR